MTPDLVRNTLQEALAGDPRALLFACDVRQHSILSMALRGLAGEFGKRVVEFGSSPDGLADTAFGAATAGARALLLLREHEWQTTLPEWEANAARRPSANVWVSALRRHAPLDAPRGFEIRLVSADFGQGSAGPTWSVFGRLSHLNRPVPCTTVLYVGGEAPEGLHAFSPDRLWPLDLDVLRDSVEQTHRVLIAHSGECGTLCARIKLALTEGFFGDLDEPVACLKS